MPTKRIDVTISKSIDKIPFRKLNNKISCRSVQILVKSESCREINIESSNNLLPFLNRNLMLLGGVINFCLWSPFDNFFVQIWVLTYLVTVVMKKIMRCEKQMFRVIKAKSLYLLSFYSIDSQIDGSALQDLKDIKDPNVLKIIRSNLNQVLQNDGIRFKKSWPLMNRLIVSYGRTFWAVLHPIYLFNKLYNRINSHVENYKFEDLIFN
jgi:hypothetical protein